MIFIKRPILKLITYQLKVVYATFYIKDKNWPHEYKMVRMPPLKTMQPETCNLKLN